MPPRSAIRKAKKSTPKSKRRDNESSAAADELRVSEVPYDRSTPVDETEEVESWIVDAKEEINAQEGNVLAKNVVEEVTKVVEAEEGKVVEGDEAYGVEKENEGLEVSSMEVEVLVSSVVEVKVKEEVVEEEESMNVVVEENSNLADKNLSAVMEDNLYSTDKNLGAFMEDNLNSAEKILGAVMEDNSNSNGEVVEEEVKDMDPSTENNSALNGEDVVEKGDVALKERGEVEGGESESKSQGDVNGAGSQIGVDQGAEQNTVEEETPAAHFEEMKALEDGVDIHDVKEGGDGEEEGGKSGHDEEDSEEDNEEDEDPSEFFNDPLTDRKKQKDLEIYIGGLDKGAVEEDLIKIFGKFGEIQAARIVRNSATNKSKGFAFIQYATVEQAKSALSELKDGIEVRGKRAKISASQGNDTLYMGNICKTWTKEKILETLKGFGIEQIDEIRLPNDAKKEGKSRGFALLEFSTHSDAMAALQRLRKPDAVFGRDRSAKVAFAQSPMHPNEDVLSQIKTVHVEGLTNSWDEEKVKEICKQYGEIERVKLSRNLNTKRKDFGFITFTSRESALACMAGINNAQIGEGEVKVKANIAKPQVKDPLRKGTRGGFKVNKESERTEQAGSSKIKDHAKSKGVEKESERTQQAGRLKMKGHAKSRGAEKKGKALAEEKGKAPPNPEGPKGGKQNKRQNSVIKGQGVGVPSNPERRNHKRKNLPSKVDGRRRRDVDHGYSQRPSKKARGNMPGRQSNDFRNPRSNPHYREGPVYVADSVAYRNPYASGYAASSSSYPTHAYSAISGSKRRHSDMEPHAGYLDPAVGKQARPHAGYAEPPLGTRGQPHAVYREPAVRNQAQPHAVYVEPALGTQGQHHAGYLEPAVVNQSHDPYDHGLRRVGGYDGQGSRGSAFVGGSALPHSYVPTQTSYAGYEGGGAGVGDYYRSSGGAFLPRRTYY